MYIYVFTTEGISVYKDLEQKTINQIHDLIEKAKEKGYLYNVVQDGHKVEL